MDNDQWSGFVILYFKRVPQKNAVKKEWIANAGFNMH